MPKKANTQLNDVVAILRAEAMPITTERKAAIMAEIQTKFNCSKQTAYYYYFYKAQKVLQNEGVTVTAPRKSAEKKAKKNQSVSDMIANLPKPQQDAMRAGSPFAALMV